MEFFIPLAPSAEWLTASGTSGEKLMGGRQTLARWTSSSTAKVTAVNSSCRWQAAFSAFCTRWENSKILWLPTRCPPDDQGAEQSVRRASFFTGDLKFGGVAPSELRLCRSWLGPIGNVRSSLCLCWPLTSFFFNFYFLLFVVRSPSSNIH